MEHVESKKTKRKFAQQKASKKKRQSKFSKNAMRFIEPGFAIFPLVENGKKPLTTHGFKDATTNPRQIREWGREFPDANIGIRTGGANGIVGIDLDLKDGRDGKKAFKTLRRKLKVEIPETYRVSTPSGGEHIYFRTKYAAEIRNSAGGLGEGIDLRGEGGYLGAEGNVIDGKRYQCIEGSLDGIALLPKALRLKIQEPRRRRTNSGGEFKEGVRNDSLFLEARGLHRNGGSFERILQTIRSLNESFCKPPLNDKDVLKIVKSACSYENSPRPNDVPETALTDMGAARRFAIANAGRMAYVPELGKHGTWLARPEGQHWRIEKGGEYVAAKAAALELLAKVPKIDDLKTQESVSKFAIRSQSKTLIEACLKLARTEPELAVSIKQFDRERWLLPVQNGVFDLRTEFFRPTGDDDYFLNVCPVSYDAEAQCPNWLEFLELVQPRRAIRRYLQKLVGLTLVGTAAPELIIFLYGDGGTGKSTFVNTVMSMLGDGLAIKFPTGVLLARDRDGSANELLKFKGARMAVASEVPASRRFNEAMLKDLSSNDLLSTRALFNEAFQFRPTHTLWIFGNELPRVSSSDTGVWRRLSLLPFETIIPETMVDIHFFAKKLEPELPGILNWAIEGCLAWQENGVRPPLRVRHATRCYRSDNDVMSEFIGERIVKRVGKKVRANVVYQTYREWAIEQGERPVTNKVFGAALIKRGLNRKRDGRGNFYTDVKVLRHGQ